MRLSRSNYMIASQGNLKSPGCSFIKVKPGFRRTWKFWKYGLFVANSGKLGKFQIKKKIVKFFVATNSLIFWLLNKLLVNTMIFLSVILLWARGGEGTQKWTPQDRERGSKLVENLWWPFMDDGQHIFYWWGTRGEIMYLLPHWGKWQGYLNGNSGKLKEIFFELFCLKPENRWPWKWQRYYSWPFLVGGRLVLKTKFGLSKLSEGKALIRCSIRDNEYHLKVGKNWNHSSF